MAEDTSTIDEMRAWIAKLVRDSLGQTEEDIPPEQQAAKNIDALIKNAPPGMLIEELKRLAQDPEVQKMVTPHD